MLLSMYQLVIGFVEDVRKAGGGEEGVRYRGRRWGNGGGGGGCRWCETLSSLSVVFRGLWQGR